MASKHILDPVSSNHGTTIREGEGEEGEEGEDGGGGEKKGCISSLLRIIQYVIGVGDGRFFIG